MAAFDIFELDQDYPTANALLVPGPNPQDRTVFVFNYADWQIGKIDTLYSVTQSAVNSDGTWIGVLDPLTGQFNKVTLPAVEVNGEVAFPYTVVAIGPDDQIILNINVFAPINLDSVGQWVFNKTDQSGQYLTVGF